jgi:L-lactate dehydrogenase complex protein LldE
MRVSLFVTCVVDQFWPSIATSAVEVLRRVGCEVEFDNRQTCCGQPAFNTGFRREAKDLATRLIEVFEDSHADAVVGPSGSCVAMVRHFPELFSGDEAWVARARAVADRTYEFASFLVNVLKVEDVGAKFEGRITWHDACHALRELGVRSEPRALINRIRGVELVELPNSDACCGFGGTFSVKYPEISTAIVDEKIRAIEQSGVRAVVSLDASCLMQIGGRLSRTGSSVQALHLAELLAAT